MPDTKKPIRRPNVGRVTRVTRPTAGTSRTPKPRRTGSERTPRRPVVPTDVAPTKRPPLRVEPGALHPNASKLQSLVHQLQQLDRQSREAEYAQARVLKRIRDQRLWEPGYDDFDDFIADGLGRSRSVVFDLLRVATDFTKAQFIKHGPNKLRLVTRYRDQYAPEQTLTELLKSNVEYRDAVGIQSVQVAQATIRQLRAALAFKRPKTWNGGAISHADKQLITAFAQRLPAAPPIGRPRARRIRSMKAQDGRIALTLYDIPTDGMHTLIRAIQQTWP